MKKILLNLLIATYSILLTSCNGDFMISNTTPVTFDNNSLFVSFDIYVDNMYKGNVSPCMNIHINIHNGPHILKAEAQSLFKNVYTRPVNLDGTPYLFKFGVL